MSTDKAYDMNLGGTAIAFSGTCLSWFVLTYLGRRKIYLVGMSLLCGVQLLIAILDAATSSSGGLWAQAALCIIWSFTYSVTVGPIAYCIVSETSSVRLRPLSVVLARNAYQLVNIVSQILQSYFMYELHSTNRGTKANFDKEPDRMERLRKDRFLLGWYSCDGLNMGILQTAGVQGTHVRGIGHPVCEQDQGQRVQEDVC